MDCFFLLRTNAELQTKLASKYYAGKLCKQRGLRPQAMYFLLGEIPSFGRVVTKSGFQKLPNQCVYCLLGKRCIVYDNVPENGIEANKFCAL